MKVEIKTKGEHPEQNGAVHDHDSPSVNFGCSDPWFVAGSDGTAKPNYLLPAALGVLIGWSRTTKGMGVYPNADGHQCIADAIWEADTIEPRVTPPQEGARVRRTGQLGHLPVRVQGVGGVA